jgi:hypothetical protein
MGGVGNAGHMGGPGNGSSGNGWPGGGPVGGAGYGGGMGGPGNRGGMGGPGNGGAMGGPGGEPVGRAGYGGPRAGRQYWLPNGRRVPPGFDQPYRQQAPGPAGGTRGQSGPGQAGGHPVAPDAFDDGWSRTGRASGPPPQAPGAPPTGARGAYSPPGGPEPRERPGPRGPYGIQGEPVPHEGVPGPGPVIRQREPAVPPERPVGSTASAAVASIAPDGLEAFARDLRALRAKAELDYPEMAEVSHYTMKTLASAAGGLRLPTLPVAVAYVRACGGNVTEWEERWQRLAAKLSADTAKKRRPDGDEQPEASDTPASPESPAVTTVTPEPDSAPGEVYVITSAPPRQPSW